jgi:hypothetical protein
MARLWAHHMKAPVAIAVTLLIVIITIGFTMAIIPFIAFGDHIRQHNEYTIHKQNEFYENIYDIYIFSLYIQSPDDPRCMTGYAINDKGACTLTKYHYDAYVVYLLTELPEDCDQEQKYCFKNKGVYLLLGHDNLLWQIITKLKYMQ